MRRILLTLTIGTAALTSLCAQDFVAPAPQRHEVETEHIIIEPKPTVEGIVKEIFETRKPWQMVNPAAPAVYGSGEKYVSKDSGPGTVYHSTGVVVLGVEW